MSEEKLFTQEQLDVIVQDRLAKEKKKFAQLEEKTADYDELKQSNINLNKELEDSRNSLNSLNEKYTNKENEFNNLVKENESFKIKNLKINIALQHGLPYEFAERLKGNDEKTISEDAKNLKSFFDVRKPIAPLKGVEEKEKSELERKFGNLI